MELKNCMEDAVLEYLDAVLAQYPGACRCEKCRYDVVALALNALPPCYVVTARGRAFIKARHLQRQFEADIVAAISRAVQKVAANPQHEKE